MSSARCLVIGHRGWHDHVTENTVAAVNAALAAGADGVEVDLRRTADGVIVLHHDESIEGMSIGRATLVALRRRQPALATLGDVLAVINGRGFVDLELKESGYEGDVLRTVQASGLPRKQFMLSSFSDRIIRTVRLLDPAVQCGLIAGASSLREPFKWALQQVALERATRCGAHTLVIHHGMATPRLLKRAARRGMPLMVWTVNDPARAQALAAEPGVSAIITDAPHVMAGLVSQRDSISDVRPGSGTT